MKYLTFKLKKPSGLEVGVSRPSDNGNEFTQGRVLENLPLGLIGLKLQPNNEPIKCYYNSRYPTMSRLYDNFADPEWKSKGQKY